MEKPGKRNRKPRSLIVTAMIIWAITAFIPPVAVVNLEAVISAYYRGEPTVLSRALNPAPPMSKLFRVTDVIARKANIALINDPSRLLNQDFLDSLVVPGISVHVRIEGKDALHSGEFPEINPGMLPLFGSIPGIDSPPPNPEQNPFIILNQMDFFTLDRRQATFFVLRGAPHARNESRARQPEIFGFSRSIVLFSVIILVAFNGLAGLFFMARLIKPLSNLERAAHTLGSGDFSVTIPKPDVRELDPVFQAFESMRFRLSEMMEQERRDERARRELIANLSHDVRTPLTTLRGYLDGLADGVADTPEKRERYLRTLRDQAFRLAHMMDNIFLLATLQGNDVGLSCRRIDMAEFLSSGAGELGELYESAGLSIAFRNAPDGASCMVEADPLHLRRVMENIITNSLNHGGRSDIGITIFLERDGQNAVVRIRDNGRGFPEACADKVFERSWRDDETRSGKGSGLGLAIAKEIILSHGGSIRAYNSGDDSSWPGAVVEFTLPLASGNSGKAQS